MHLKSLTLLGFKSFADKTSLTFQPGITCIVGPNGCGKSNVADAIRWVLGEQSAKVLRGGEMSDVVFNGTDGRKPLAMAEVSLTISDIDDHLLRAAGVNLDYNEVTVTRRVFRDGGSEYFVNRTPCRLKDIQHLFMGTGVGRSSYSIMAQGNITQILSSKPEDRRLVFEEAAGITRFKSQKREALRKLEYTEQNLLRISDLIREVKRQIGSLQRQAGKARRYKQIQQELQHLETQLARHQFDILQIEIEQRSTALEQLRQQIEHTSEQVLQQETEVLQLRSQLTDLEHQISQSQQQSLELRNQTERHEHRIQFNEERLRELEARHGQALRDIALAEERQTAASAELDAARDRLTQATQTLDRLRTTLEVRQTAVRTVESHSAQTHAAIRDAQANLFTAAQLLSRFRNELNALELLKQGNLVRLEKLSSEKIQLEEERARAETRLHEFSASVEAERLQARDRRLSLEDQQKQLLDLQSQLASVTRQIDARVEEQATLRSRLGVLEQLQSEHEGFSAGALAALRQTQETLGSLADRIQVPDPYVVAIENALGHHLQLVLTTQPHTAQHILATLASRKQGRASIAPLEWPDPGPQTAGQSDGHPGQPALECIQADPSIQPLLNRLLGHTRIVTTLDEATRASTKHNHPFDYVTLTGEVLTRHGVFTGGDLGGSESPTNPASILGRKNQIAQLQNQLATLATELTETSRHKGQLSAQHTSALACLQSSQTDLRNREVAIATREGEVTALHHALRLLQQKIETVVFEIQSLADQEEESRLKRADLAAHLTGAEQQQTQRQTELDGLTTELETLRQERETAVQSLTEVRVQLASEEQLLQALSRQLQPLENRIAELNQLVHERRGTITDCLQRQTQANTEITESRQRISTLQHQRDQLNQQTALLEARRQELETGLVAREDLLRQHRRQLTELQQQRGTLEIELAQKNLGVEHLRERIQQKYQLRLDDIRSECITITLADQGPPVRTLTPEEMAAAGVATDWTPSPNRSPPCNNASPKWAPSTSSPSRNTRKPNNVTSSSPNSTTTSSTPSPNCSKSSPASTPRPVPSSSKPSTKIRANFRTMFTEVFGGGKADLRLVDEGDVLESGIDIVARPPGKQLQTISLLSGGEQTMTAVALLFAIYQVKPSPFCVLDELDAPLDESNINRFIRILQRSFLAHLPVHHHHPQQTHHRHGRRPLRRHHAGTGHQPHRQRQVPQGRRWQQRKINPTIPRINGSTLSGSPSNPPTPNLIAKDSREKPSPPHTPPANSPKPPPAFVPSPLTA
jgi:chromosome segregation protein